jgi:hypothetical protein
MSITQAVYGQLEGYSALRAIPHDRFDPLPDHPRQQAVRREQHDRRSVVPVKGPGDLDKIVTQEYFPAREGKPQQGTERRRDLFYLLEGQLGPGLFSAVIRPEIETEGTVGITSPGNEKGQMDRSSLPGYVRYVSER